MDRRKLIILEKGGLTSKKKWANNYIKFKSKNWIIINKKDIRNVINHNYCIKKERFVEDIENYLILKSLLFGFDVILIIENIQLLNKIDYYKNIQLLKSQYEHLFHLDIEVEDITNTGKQNFFTTIINKLKRNKKK